MAAKLTEGFSLAEQEPLHQLRWSPSPSKRLGRSD